MELKNFDFPTSDHLRDLFSDVLDTNKIYWNYLTIDQFGREYIGQLNYLERIKYYKTKVNIYFGDDFVPLSFDSYRDTMLDTINGLSELNDYFDEFNYVNNVYEFFGNNYFITNIKDIKLFLRSLDIVLNDCGMSCDIKLMNEFVLVTYNSLSKELIDFISDHDYYLSKDQIFIKTDFDWCEKG